MVALVRGVLLLFLGLVLLVRLLVLLAQAILVLVLLMGMIIQPKEVVDRVVIILVMFV